MFQGLNHTIVGIIGFIGKDGAGLNLRQEMISSDQIVDLPRRHQEARGIAKGIGSGMDFGRQTAARPTDGLFVRLAARRPTTMLMSPNQGTVDHDVFLIGILGQEG